MHDFSLLSIIPSLFSNQTKLAVFPFCLFKRLSFHSFFLSYVRTETHTAADMHKLSHRCLTRQYEHIDISISLRFYSHSFLFFFFLAQGLFMRKSLLAWCLKQSTKIRYSIGVNESSLGKKAFLLHLLKCHEYVCPYYDSNLNKEVQIQSKRWLAVQMTQSCLPPIM